ncbi:hypothetical protein B0J18DRAFT_452904 [Chaetomium sp. MPI-SDFR-AT-0129]|nr:hypothetical protein B0J18DRAFT_452904 [Chaetomium sp. MPI-SDFR-AT-0129]
MGDRSTPFKKKPKSRRGIQIDGEWHCACDPRKPAIVQVVTKNGSNYGRRFYSCLNAYKPNDCRFFWWKDEPKQPGGIVGENAGHNTTLGQGSSNIPPQYPNNNNMPSEGSDMPAPVGPQPDVGRGSSTPRATRTGTVSHPPDGLGDINTNLASSRDGTPPAEFQPTLGGHIHSPTSTVFPGATTPTRTLFPNNRRQGLLSGLDGDDSDASSNADKQPAVGVMHPPKRKLTSAGDGSPEQRAEHIHAGGQTTTERSEAFDFEPTGGLGQATNVIGRSNQPEKTPASAFTTPSKHRPGLGSGTGTGSLGPSAAKRQKTAQSATHGTTPTSARSRKSPMFPLADSPVKDLPMTTEIMTLLEGDNISQRTERAVRSQLNTFARQAAGIELARNMLREKNQAKDIKIARLKAQVAEFRDIAVRQQAEDESRQQQL